MTHPAAFCQTYVKQDVQQEEGGGLRGSSAQHQQKGGRVVDDLHTHGLTHTFGKVCYLGMFPAMKVFTRSASTHTQAHPVVCTCIKQQLVHTEERQGTHK